MDLTTTRYGSVVVVTVSGDVDLASAPTLEEEALAALGDGVSGLIVDLTEVQFLASMGMAVLVELSKRTAETTAFAVVAQGAVTARPLELLGLHDVISIHPRLDQALIALGSAPE